MSSTKKILQETADYLYKIEGDIDSIMAVKIGFLRQFINEEYVPKKNLVSSQMIYDFLFKDDL